MSAGSSAIIIQVDDGVNPNIAIKIRDIGAAATTSASALAQLQAQLKLVQGGTANLSNVIQQLTPKTATAAQGTNRLEGSLAQLASRVVGMEAGFGMLGGALGRVGVAAGVAGPLIVAALGVGAVVGAIEIYEKFDEAARKLETTQIALNEQFERNRTTLLEQSEEITGLVNGPLAKYAQQLNDLPFKEIVVNIDNITKKLKDQQSVLATSASLLERYSQSGSNPIGGSVVQVSAQPAPFDLKQAQDFIQKSKADISGSTNQLQGLYDALTKTGAKLTELHDLEEQQSGATKDITDTSRRGIQDYYQELTDDYHKYLNTRKKDQLGADGEFLAQQKKAAEDEVRAYKNQLENLKENNGGVISPQQKQQVASDSLSVFTQDFPGSQNAESPFAQYRAEIAKDLGNATQEIDRQNKALEDLVNKYADAKGASESYSQALQIQIAQGKAAEQVGKIAPDNDNAASTITKLNAIIAATIKDSEVKKQEIATYNEFNEPLLRYNAAIEASARLLAVGAISTNQATIADAQATRVKVDALNPLNEYTIGLEHQVGLFGQYGTALTVVSEVDRVRQDLQKTGRDLTNAETQSLTQFLTQLEHQKQLQSDINQLYEQNAGSIEKLVIQQQALNQAKDKGIIAEGQYKIATAQNNVALAQQALLEGKNATLQDQVVGGLGKFLQGYKGLAAGISDVYGQLFDTIGNGIANSIGQAIVYGKDLGDALKDVARTAISELISGFVKLGLQWVITEAIGKSLAQSGIAATIAEAEAVSAAWAPAAAFASLASFGANAAPAGVAISSTVALSEILSAVGSSFATGGYVAGPGNGTSDSILAMLSNGEYVVNAKATAANRAILEQMNSGSSTIRSSPVSVGFTGDNRPIVNIIHDGSTNVSAKQMTDGSIRVVARQEAEAAVHRLAPSVIAGELVNPNSRPSKAIAQNTTAKRNR